MAEVGRKLTSADINAVASWLALQPVPADAKPAAVAAGAAADAVQRDGAMSRRHARRLLYPAASACWRSLVLAAPALVALNLRGEDKLPRRRPPFEATPAQVERGRYLALAGNCAGCHTARGGAPYAGGVGIDTPFGTIYASNLTPDAQAPASAAGASTHFWRAMHNGRSKDGRLLYPAFPYPSFTHVTREDSDAIYAYLRSVPPAPTPNTPHALRFPYDTQAGAGGLARALVHARHLRRRSGEAGRMEPRRLPGRRPRATASPATARATCWAPRRRSCGLSGGLIPVENWYAPSLTSTREAGVADWDAQRRGGPAQDRHARRAARSWGRWPTWCTAAPST